MVGKRISHYDILERIGQGGMGMVYKARDTTLGRIVALKFLPWNTRIDEQARERLSQEARASSRVNHPNVCTVHSIEEEDGERFIVMEFVDGTNLSAVIASARTSGCLLDPTVILGYARQIADALIAAHELGIVHRDVKSDNIMVNAEGRIKIMDFGIARMREEMGLTAPGRTTGTLQYMAPELLSGAEPDPRADIFSFGVVLYELLTGELPFRAHHEAALVYTVCNEPHPPVSQHRSDIPEALLAVLDRCLEKNPDRRYQDMRAVRSDLRSSAAGEGDTTTTDAPSPRTTEVRSIRAASSHPLPVRSRFRGWLWPAAVIVAAVLGVFIYRAVVTSPSGAGNPVRLAVMPFLNIGNNEENEPFTDGLTETLITNLAKIDQLQVISRTSVMPFKKRQLSPREVARQLKVSYLLEGSFLRTGDRCQVSAKLVRASDEITVWAEEYRMNWSDIFDIMTRVTENVLHGVHVTLHSSCRCPVRLIPSGKR